MEMCVGGDLHSYVRRRKRLPEDLACFFFKQVVEAVCYCHQKQVAHRDLKPDNLLLQEDGVIKLCDFGVSRKMLNGFLMNDHVGTPAFMAPEIQQKKSYVGWAADIWSLGILLYTLVTGTVPFRNANTAEELIEKTSKANFEFPQNLKLSTQIKDLITSCLKVNPGRRPTTTAILKHAWF
jgi:serine/threonine protein kinase